MMEITIDRAIDVLTEWKNGDFEGDPDELHRAEQLGILGLMRIRDYRNTKFSIPKMLLSGEAKE